MPVTLIGGTQDNNSDAQRPVDGEARLTMVEILPNGTRRHLGRGIGPGSQLGLQSANVDLPWALRPWSYKQSPSGLQQLLADVPELASLSAPRTVVTPQAMENLLTLRPRIRAALTKLIKAAGGVESFDFNAPSICLYSGPDPERDGFRAAYEERGTDASIAQNDPVGWITTGDAVLGRYEDEFLIEYERYLSHVGTYVVPHHGAKKNHSPSLIDYSRGRLALICAKQGSKHHPHPDVLDTIAY